MFDRRRAIQDFYEFGGEANENMPQPAPQTVVMMGLSNWHGTQREIVQKAVANGFNLRNTRKCLAVWVQKNREIKKNSHSGR